MTALEGESSQCVKCTKANWRYCGYGSRGPVNGLLHHLEFWEAVRTHGAAFAYGYAACLIMK
jgi:hypothetical protein